MLTVQNEKNNVTEYMKDTIGDECIIKKESVKNNFVSFLSVLLYKEKKERKKYVLNVCVCISNVYVIWIYQIRETQTDSRKKNAVEIVERQKNYLKCILMNNIKKTNFILFEVISNI